MALKEQSAEFCCDESWKCDDHDVTETPSFTFVLLIAAHSTKKMPAKKQKGPLGFTGDVGKEGRSAQAKRDSAPYTPEVGSESLLVIFPFVVPFSKSNEFMLVGEQGNSVDDSPAVNLSAASPVPNSEYSDYMLLFRICELRYLLSIATTAEQL